MTKRKEAKLLPKTAPSLFFYKKGKAKIASVVTSLDIFQKNLHKNGRWNVAIKPLVVGLCPSDMAGGMLEFPPGSTRSFSDPKNPAVPGHEFVGRIVEASKTAKKDLFKKGINIGDMVVGDINVGCGFCLQCKRHDPAVYCRNGATFAGVGTSPDGVGWVKEQTGRPHLPGAYTEGFIVLPVTHIHRISPAFKNMQDMILFSQADAVACSKTSCDTMGLTTFKQVRGIDNPDVLIIGCGRLGTWHAAVIQEILPDARIFIADIKKENIAFVGKLFNIPDSRRYHITKNAFLGKNLQNVFGKGIFFDFIIDTAGHGVLSGQVITDLLLSKVANGGKFWTTSHTGISGVDAGHPELLLKSKGFGNGLSPQNNFPYAIDFLARHHGKYKHIMVEIPGGLSEALADIVSTGGSEYKKRATGITFYTLLGNTSI